LTRILFNHEEREEHEGGGEWIDNGRLTMDEGGGEWIDNGRWMGIMVEETSWFFAASWWITMSKGKGQMFNVWSRLWRRLN